jgi:hypothetical protein
VRLQTEFRRNRVALAALLICAPACGASFDPSPPVMAGRTPSRTQIEMALDRTRADPKLSAQQKVRTLRWQDSSQPDENSTLPSWLTWLVEFFAWLAHAGRILIWVAAAVLSAFLVIYIARVIRARGLPRASGQFIAPTHVRDMDIRPESLPDDIGTAARALWDGGEHRAALALLYRGLLSRLVHVHDVPIRDSSTEGDCLTLVSARLNPKRKDYAIRLVRVWQRSVYGGQEPDGASVHTLCDGFAGATVGPSS